MLAGLYFLSWNMCLTSYYGLEASVLLETVSVIHRCVTKTSSLRDGQQLAFIFSEVLWDGDLETT